MRHEKMNLTMGMAELYMQLNNISGRITNVSRTGFEYVTYNGFYFIPLNEVRLSLGQTVPAT